MTFPTSWALNKAFSPRKRHVSKSLNLIVYLSSLLDVHPSRFINYKLHMKLMKSHGFKSSFVFSHCPKTGGTYINKRLNNFVFTIGHDLLTPYLFPRKPIPVGLGSTHWRKAKKDIVFSVVRHPLSLLVSYYYHVLGIAPDYSNTRHYDYELAQSGFKNFILNITNRDGSKWPSRNFLYPNLFDHKTHFYCNYILLNEDLDNALETMYAIYGINIPPRLESKVRAQDSSNHPKPIISDDIRALIDKTYKREIQLFYSDFNSRQFTAHNQNKSLLSPSSFTNLKYNLTNDVLKGI